MKIDTAEEKGAVWRLVREKRPGLCRKCGRWCQYDVRVCGDCGPEEHGIIDTVIVLGFLLGCIWAIPAIIKLLSQ